MFKSAQGQPQGQGQAQGSVTEEVLSADIQPAWCSVACWETMADSVISALSLKTPYPGKGPVIPCSVCALPVTLTALHVGYVLLDMEVTDAPWLASAKVHWSRLLAVLCLTCESPAVADESLEHDETHEQKCDVKSTARAAVDRTKEVTI